jgi:copper chaperone CopZ
MKKFIFSLLLLGLVSVQTSQARTIDIDIQGMTCAFCADSLNRHFNSMKSISKVDVSLSLKKVHLETEANSPKLETIKEIIINSGFTPINVVVKP